MISAGRKGGVAAAGAKAAPPPPPAPDAGAAPALDVPPKRHRVAVVLAGAAAAGGISSFSMLYGMVVEELKGIRTVEVDPGGDLVAGTTDWVNNCLHSPDASVADTESLLCISHVGQAINADYEFIIRVNAVGDEKNDVSLTVVENSTATTRGNIRFVGTVGDLWKVARRLVHQAFDPKPPPGPAAGPAAAAAPRARQEAGREAAVVAEPVPSSAPLDLSVRGAPPRDVSSAFVMAPAPPPQPHFAERWRLPLIFGSSAVAAAAAATILGVLAKRREEASHGAKRRGPAFDEYRSAERFTLSANITFGVSAVLGGAAVYTSFANGPAEGNAEAKSE